MWEKRKKIGILGGTFDPIHYGHLVIAENAICQYHLDQVWFIPTGQSPHKDSQHVSDSTKRCKMIELAIADNDKFLLSRIEIDNKEINYTYRTLQQLKCEYPEADFFFILGGDSLKSLENWRYPEEILKTAYILAAIRDNMEGKIFNDQISYLNEKYETLGVFPLNTPSLSISSSKIRELIKNQKTIRYLLPEPVRAYIYEQKLYKIGNGKTT